MKKVPAGKLIPLAVPFGLVALACVLFAWIERIPPGMLPAVRYSSYLIFIIGLALSHWFNCSRVFFVILSLALGQLALADLIPRGPGREIYTPAYPAVSLLLPLNILVFSLIRNIGVLTREGRACALFIAAQSLFVLWLARGGSPELAGIISRGAPAGGASIPHLSMLLFLVTLSVLMIRLLLLPSQLEGPFTGVLLALALALYLREQSLAVPVFFGAAGIILAVALIQDSYRKAYLDDLTGLPGRRALKEDLARLGEKYTIAMLDIDFFKKFNDTFGHDVGDQVLRFIASIINSVSGGGKAFRYGGEEFTLIFPGKGLEETLPHLEDLREEIARRAFTLRGKGRPRKKPGQVRPGTGPTKKVKITVSIGVSGKDRRADTPDDVMAAADSALYLAKRQGRNRVCWQRATRQRD